ncbi:hypothetical protein J437_LFUL014573 [Ladona fulva]|uniref:Uncharacterized protein n=1 Tax=Ladona fulva TaxID=123851 RepID=A0A8K0KJ59_LADFU|nr:hypothetical protein J437_LFUL014573 [Ladona fulva]
MITMKSLQPPNRLQFTVLHNHQSHTCHFLRLTILLHDYYEITTTTTRRPPIYSPPQPPNSYLPPPPLPPTYDPPLPPSSYLPPTYQQASRRVSSIFPQSPQFTPIVRDDFTRHHSIQLRSPNVDSDEISLTLPPFPSRVNAEEIEDYDIAERVRNGRDTEFNPFLERSGIRALTPPLVQYLAEVGSVFKANNARRLE